MKFDIIISECKKNNRRHQKILYERFYPMVRKICYRYSSSKSDGDTLALECLTKIFTKLDTFNGTDHAQFGAWAKRLTINKCIDVCRLNSTRKQRELAVPVIFDSMWKEEVDESTEEDNVEYTHEDIVKAMYQLSPQYRTIFSMYLLLYKRGFGFDSAATSLLSSL